MTPELNPNFPEETTSDAWLTTADGGQDGGAQEPEEDGGEERVVAEELSPSEELPPMDAMVAEVEEIAPVVSAQLEEDPPPLADLTAQKTALEKEIAALQREKAQWYGQQFQQLQREMAQLVEEGTRELVQKRAALEKEIEKLERRQERIQQEMRTTFAGASQELAIRVQGFKDYLVGSLQDLVSAADQLELGVGDSWESSSTHGDAIIENADTTPVVSFAEQGFGSQKRQIQALLEQYRTRPDYYGPPWQLRRTFEPIHAERIENWLFTLGGRGAILSLDSRLQNILVGSAAIAILNQLYGDRCRA
nr:DUF3086 domain-containing protein [Synechocystis salina]